MYSYHLFMNSFHSVLGSFNVFFLIDYGLIFVRSGNSVMHSSHYVLNLRAHCICSFNVLFWCVLGIRLFYVLFLCAFLMFSLYSLFAFALFMRSFYVLHLCAIFHALFLCTLCIRFLCALFSCAILMCFFNKRLAVLRMH